MLTVLTPKKMRAIVSKLYNMAMAGDRDAIREVLNRGLRKPTTVEDET